LWPVVVVVDTTAGSTTEPIQTNRGTGHRDAGGSSGATVGPKTMENAEAVKDTTVGE